MYKNPIESSDLKNLKINSVKKSPEKYHQIKKYLRQVEQNHVNWTLVKFNE